MRARRSAPNARLSLIENQDHTLPNDSRQLAKNEPLDSVNLALPHCPSPSSMIKQAGILLTLCATSLVVINIRTLETVERSGRGIDDDDPYNDKDDYEVRRGTGYRVPLVIETCLVARWAGYPAAFSSSWGFFADLEMAGRGPRGPNERRPTAGTRC